MHGDCGSLTEQCGTRQSRYFLNTIYQNKSWNQHVINHDSLLFVFVAPQREFIQRRDNGWHAYKSSCIWKKKPVPNWISRMVLAHRCVTLDCGPARMLDIRRLLHLRPEIQVFHVLAWRTRHHVNTIVNSVHIRLQLQQELPTIFP